ncbi:hypothetical protein EDF87_1093 [Pseudomonas helmanticensis]|uniref:Uncharacterized protein n=1 Tax=Pseudomonas helmanticensis TaxID=1471381 RepID=A0A4R7V6J8_9PSED|nr:tetratricopeptide repeat protein [Pseudomonas helmanticensis]TDV45118.1 hypothetical protein EDF87_1093 [Pseudomonas helmanticensis]
MKKIIFSLLLGYCSLSFAEVKQYVLNPVFSTAGKAEFVMYAGDQGQTLKGSLIAQNGKHFDLPDACEPEGGDAELKDAFTVKGKKTYFLFTCAWSVKHSGIGLNGTQYETYVYTSNDLASIEKVKVLSQNLSAYEGSLEGGGNSYAWYAQRKLSAEKIMELESGKTTDSLTLAHDIVLARLKDMDYDAVKSYLSHERLEQLKSDYPIGISTVVAYNDFGYALAQAGEYEKAYQLLTEIEKSFPDRVVLKLNIADVLWETNRAQSTVYYKAYVDLMQKSGKAKLIPAKALERSANK